MAEMRHEIAAKEEHARLASSLAAELEEARAELADTQAQLHERRMEVSAGGGGRGGVRVCQLLQQVRLAAGARPLHPTASAGGGQRWVCRPSRAGFLIDAPSCGLAPAAGV
jgi:hypothetical protein